MPSINANSSVNVELVPNPATDAFTVNFNAPQEGNTAIRIVNMVGQEVYKITLGNMKNGNVNIPINGLATGVYIVTLKCGDISVAKRLVVQ